jgi:hypothetical protein
MKVRRTGSGSAAAESVDDVLSGERVPEPHRITGDTDRSGIVDSGDDQRRCRPLSSHEGRSRACGHGGFGPRLKSLPGAIL